ncbi:MAG: Hsp70 family protein [Deltaproteobacteria bacterium]|nr:Hsp70 family protein [Deltaproteobacteria bacterium]
MVQVIGIDLGTTNSCVSVMENGAPVVIPNRGGYKTTPSMVAMTEAGKRLVGHIAKRQAITNAENTVYSAKRLIGRKWGSEQVEISREMCSYEIVEGPHADVRIRLRDNLYSVQEVSAMVLQEMRIVAEEYGADTNKAVITVPAYFNDSQRQATKDAGSILEIGAGGVFKVVATAGDTFLGGEDFDALIIDLIEAGFRREHNVDLRSDRMALQRLKDAAEKAKCELSTATETEINLPFLISVGRSSEALHLQRPLRREEIEGACRHLVDRCVEICRGCLREAELEPRDVDEVVLVGGMTRMPMVKRAAAELFGREPCQGVHPDEAVAVGAAIQGVALVDEEEELILLDVTPHPLGIMTSDRKLEELIAQNTTVPTSQKKIFTTSRDNQTAVRILVMQGHGQTSEDQVLGEFMLTGLRPAPKGQLEIEVTFAIDSDGIVAVSARDTETGKQQSIQVTASSGLTKEEVRQMVQSAEHFMVERKASDEMELARQEAEKLVVDVEQMFPEVERIVASSDFGREAVNKARGVLEQVRQAMAGHDLNALREQSEALARTHRMFKGVVSRPK